MVIIQDLAGGTYMLQPDQQNKRSFFLIKQADKVVVWHNSGN